MLSTVWIKRVRMWRRDRRDCGPPASERVDEPVTRPSCDARSVCPLPIHPTAPTCHAGRLQRPLHLPHLHRRRCRLALRHGRLGAPRRRHQGDGRQDDLRADRRRVSGLVERPRHQRRRLQVLLRRHQPRGRGARRRRARVEPAAAHPPRHPHHRRLGRRGRLLRHEGRRRALLRRTDVLLPPPDRRLQQPRLVQRRPAPAVRRPRQRRQDDLRLERGRPRGRPGRPVRAPAGVGVLHHLGRGLDRRHLAADGRVGAALQVRLGRGRGLVEAALVAREALRRRHSVGSGLVHEGAGRDRGHDQERRQDAPRGHHADAQGGPPGRDGVHHGQAGGGEEGVGAHRAGLRRLVQRPGLRLRRLPERQPERPPRRRLHDRLRRRHRLRPPRDHIGRSRRDRRRDLDAPRHLRGHAHLRRSRRAVRGHDPALAHLQEQRPDQLEQSMQRVHVRGR